MIEILPEVELLPVLESIAESVAFLDQHSPPDLLLLDIHLADGASFEIFQHVTVKTPIVFTTAYDQYAIDAFKVNAIDYLLKPIKREALARAIDKFKDQQVVPLIDYQKLAQQLEVRNEARFLIRLGSK